MRFIVVAALEAHVAFDDGAGPAAESGVAATGRAGVDLDEAFAVGRVGAGLAVLPVCCRSHGAEDSNATQAGQACRGSDPVVLIRARWGAGRCDGVGRNEKSARVAPVREKFFGGCSFAPEIIFVQK